MQKIYIETYGCSNNTAESQMMAAQLKDYIITNDEKDADFVIINTCSVKSTTEQRILHRINELKNKKLIIAGCMVDAESEVIKKIKPNTTMIGTHNINRIREAVDAEKNNTYIQLLEKPYIDKSCLPKTRKNKVIDIIPVSSGCLSFCSFCSTKLAKGNLISFPENNIINEIKSAKIGGGAKEFWLTSQDCGCYGFDIETNLAKLLKNITAVVPGTYFIRPGMANPQHIKRILPELIESYKSGNVYKFLHIPVQSGSDKILREMKRGHNTVDYITIVDMIRKEIPEITIWTDIIVGFPGETELDFKKSMEIIRKTEPDVVNISTFSVRPNTKASLMKQIKTEIKKERTKQMSELTRNISLEKNKAWIGWKGCALVNEYNEKKSNFIARNYAYKPIVIKNAEIGAYINIEIMDASATCLFGKTI